MNVVEFYETMCTDLLFGDGVSANNLNDVALGRGLDILHDANIETLYRQVAMSAPPFEIHRMTQLPSGTKIRSKASTVSSLRIQR